MAAKNTKSIFNEIDENVEAGFYVEQRTSDDHIPNIIRVLDPFYKEKPGKDKLELNKNKLELYKKYLEQLNRWTWRIGEDGTDEQYSLYRVKKWDKIVHKDGVKKFGKFFGHTTKGKIDPDYEYILSFQNDTTHYRIKIHLRFTRDNTTRNNTWTVVSFSKFKPIQKDGRLIRQKDGSLMFDEVEIKKNPTISFKVGPHTTSGKGASLYLKFNYSNRNETQARPVETNKTPGKNGKTSVQNQARTVQNKETNNPPLEQNQHTKRNANGGGNSEGSRKRPKTEAPKYVDKCKDFNRYKEIEKGAIEKMQEELDALTIEFKKNLKECTPSK